MNWSYVPLAGWKDLYGLPDFHQEPIDPELVKTGKAVQPYDMPLDAGERPCGIKGCSEGHRHGWLILLPDGSKSNVGRDCGLKVFGVAWNSQMNAARATQRAYSKREALMRNRELARTAAEEPIIAVGPAFDRARAMETAFDALPATIRDSLLARAQDNDTVIKDYRAPNTREIAEAKEKGLRPPDQVTYEVGKFRGLAALRPSGRVDGALSMVRSKSEALALLAASDDATADQISAAIRELRKSREALERVPRMWETFFDPHNIANFSYLQASRKLGYASVRLGPDATIEFVFR